MNRIKRTVTVITAVSLIISLAGCAVTDGIKNFLNTDTEPVGVERVEKTEISNSISVGVFDFDTFNPLLTQSETVKECMQFVYEPLFDVNESLQPIPILAESYTVSPDGRTIDITLRSGVTWQDGSAFTASDAAYTIKQIRSGITTYTDKLLNMADYKAIDDNQLQIVLNYSVPNFVSLLTFPIVKYQSDMKVNANYIPMGTGPYCYSSQVSTGKLSFTAYDGYHGGRAQIDTLNVCTVPDLAKYESMFEASEIDLMTGETVDLSEYTPRGSATNNEYITNKLTFLGFNTRSELLFGAYTRRGLSELIDKDSIVNSTIYSRGVAIDVPINPSSVYYYDTNTKFKKDEILALELLGNDGWGVDTTGDYVRSINGSKQKLKLELLTDADSAEKTTIAERIAKEFTEFGIPTSVKAVPYEQYIKRIADLDYELMIGEVEIAPNLDLTPLVSSAGNYFGYANTDLDTIIGQMGMTRDDEQLKELWRQCGAKVTEDMPFTSLFFRKGDVLSGSKIKTEVTPSITRQYRNAEAWRVRE